jgi:hypothetical protein
MIVRHIRSRILLPLRSVNVVGRAFSRKQGSSIIASQKAGEKYPWQEQLDPNGSGQTYYWNPNTDETTHLGSGKPQHWVEVQDPNGGPQTYWWCPETDQTTQLGSPRPPLFPTTSLAAHNQSPVQRSMRPFVSDNGVDAYRPQSPQQQQPSFGRTMVTYATFGAGITFAMVAVRAILGF